MNKTNKVIETGKQFILTVSECVELIATAKRGELLQFPLILYKDRHYLAYLHCTVLVPGDTMASTADSSGEDMDISQDEISDDKMKEDDEGLAEVVGADTSPLWGGDISELSTRLAACNITYTLRRDIRLIIRCSAASRYLALLEFLVNIVATSSADAQLHLLATDLLQISKAAIQRIRIDYNVSGTMMGQWKA